jgi:SAM-dependent methyltransferase
MLFKILKKKAIESSLTIKLSEPFDFNKYDSLNDTPHIDFVDEDNNFVTHPFLAHKTLYRFIRYLSSNSSILDIGCGKHQVHSNIMRLSGLSPSTNDFFSDCDYRGFFTACKFKRQFDAIWCSHVLEHVLDVQEFLSKIYISIKEGGILAIIVPPLKHEIVGGHVNLFNGGLLFYRLILAGFDCREALFERYGYNISVIMKVKKIPRLPELNYDKGDIELLSEYFPFPAYQSFNGEM